MSKLPSVYSFPPLYTRQPNSLIRRQQINTWIDLILQYCKSNNSWSMSAEGKLIVDKGNTEINSSTGLNNEKSFFLNEEIQRAASEAFIDEIWLQMFQEGKALKSERGQSSSTYYILWKSLDLWASLILQWFESSVKLNQVVTLYELSQGDESIGWEFHGMPEPLLAQCINPLCDRNRATILKDEFDRPVGLKVI